MESLKLDDKLWENLKLRNIKLDFYCIKILLSSRDIKMNFFVVCLNMIVKGPYEMVV